MALMYLYIFENNLPENHPEANASSDGSRRPFLAIYAPDRKCAEREFKNYFKVEPGELIGRNPW